MCIRDRSRAGGKPTLKLAVRGEASRNWWREIPSKLTAPPNCHAAVSYTHLRAHETVLDLVCRLLLEKKKKEEKKKNYTRQEYSTVDVSNIHIDRAGHSM